VESPIPRMQCCAAASTDFGLVGAAGTLAAGSYSYEITAATRTVNLNHRRSKRQPSHEWIGHPGVAGCHQRDRRCRPGPTLAVEEAKPPSWGTGFWGYNVYRSDTPTGTFGLIGQVAEDPTGATTSYTFTDTGATTPGGSPSSTATDPTATNPALTALPLLAVGKQRTRQHRLLDRH